jgi:hydroxypyruvate reductase
MAEIALQTVANELLRTALAAVEPASAVRRHVYCKKNILTVGEFDYDLHDYARVFVIGAGKAVVPMGNAIFGLLGDHLTQGVVVTKYRHSLAQSLPPNVRVIEAGHPIPDANSMLGAQTLCDLTSHLTRRDLVICLISGGGSALLALPVPGLALDDLQALTDVLLRSGATIDEINVVRKHLSQIKGGNLARLISPATLITLVLSDVVGDPLDVIASGPTVPDPTATADAQAILERYEISGFHLDWVSYLCETPKPGDPLFARVQNIIVGSNRLAAEAAKNKALQMGFHAQLLSTYVEGEAREVAKVAAALAKGIRAHGDPIPAPACLVWGGETTVTVHGPGTGGRNQELALAAALALDGWADVLVMALATDGTDGPTDAAGAFATGETVARARARGLDPRAALESNDSYPFWDALENLIKIGPTGTNVNDLLFVLVK